MKWLLLCVLLVGCAPRIVYTPIELQLPARPTLPVIKSAQLMCLSDEAYSVIVERDRVLKHRVELLESIILSTQK